VTPRSPIVLGTLLAALAAVAFGVVTPFVQRCGAGLGPFTTAGLLYLGAALGALPAWRRGDRPAAEPPLRAGHLPRLVAVALFGAALAPTLFAFGLQRVAASQASLLLNGEALFTVGLAALVYREHVGRRVAVAATLMAAGGVVTVLGAAGGARGGLLGAVAVIAAVLCWALDNVLTRPLADFDPAAVVRVKALLGVVMTATLALVQGEPVPRLGPLAGLVLCGATGYGLSLRLYLLAQRRIGAGRTGSVFALAPFIGVAAAVLLGDRQAGWTTALAALLFGAGVALHLTERHGHAHRHEDLEHEHAHRHDDGHHDHRHPLGDAPAAAHSHPHRHEPLAHAHPHAPDAHHGHSH
jgi:drug/metabolite transporter (DMT)-like permease